MTRKLTASSGKLRLTPRQQRAAALLADGKMTKRAVASEVGISEHTMHEWLNQPAFNTRVEQIVEQVRKRILQKGIADRVERVRRLGDIVRRLEVALDVPGVEEKAADLVALLKEYRATLQQAAQEVGQWTERREVSGTLELTNAEQPASIITARIDELAAKRDERRLVDVEASGA